MFCRKSTLAIYSETNRFESNTYRTDSTRESESDNTSCCTWYIGPRCMCSYVLSCRLSRFRTGTCSVRQYRFHVFS